MTFKE
jgi:hypothetical protein